MEMEPESHPIDQTNCIPPRGAENFEILLGANSSGFVCAVAGFFT